jgi:hypothetical protein
MKKRHSTSPKVKDPNNMKKVILPLAIGAGVLSLAAICLRAQDVAQTATPVAAHTNDSAQSRSATGKATGEIAAAAEKFHATLDDARRGKVVFDFKDSAQRKRWSNFPNPIFQRAGLRMGDLTKP